jgi:HAMP domain-containing protein
MEGSGYFAVIGGVVAGTLAGILVLYVAWRLFLRDWVERRRAAAEQSAGKLQAERVERGDKPPRD